MQITAIVHFCFPADVTSHLRVTRITGGTQRIRLPARTESPLLEQERPLKHDIVYTFRWMDLTYSPGRALFRDTMAIFKNLSSLCPCGVCLSVAPPAQSQFSVLKSRMRLCPCAKSLFFPIGRKNLLFQILGFQLLA